jgi:mRNA interferase MazF
MPDAGDVAWVFLDQTEGTGQSGRRPGLVLSNRAYHEQSRRALICPISERRMFNIIERAPEGVVAEVLAKLSVLIGIEAA